VTGFHVASVHSIALGPEDVLFYTVEQLSLHEHTFLLDSDGDALKPDPQSASRAPAGFYDLSGNSISTQVE
jgi:hypothetical protein